MHLCTKCQPYLKRILGLVTAVFLLVAVNAFMGREGLFGFGLPYYYAEIINLTGISVILAVSLNLITGFTGQFSIGHAGFMAVGAYSSAFMTVYYTEAAEQSLSGLVGSIARPVVGFPWSDSFRRPGCRVGGLMVGIPSLATTRRLPCDRHPRFRRNHSHHHSQYRSGWRRDRLSWTSTTVKRPSDYSGLRRLHLDWRLCNHHDRCSSQHRPIRHRSCVDFDSRRRAGRGSDGN